MFVGAGLDILAVTSAQSNDDDAHGRELAGSVFLVPVDVRGLPERPVACA
jgi:sugar lactone lactonase YvrE